MVKVRIRSWGMYYVSEGLPIEVQNVSVSVCVIWGHLGHCVLTCKALGINARHRLPTSQFQVSVDTIRFIKWWKCKGLIFWLHAFFFFWCQIFPMWVSEQVSPVFVLWLLLDSVLCSLCSEQARLRQQVVEEDTEDWQRSPDFSGLERVGGVDLSFIKGDDVNACAQLVVLSYPDLEVSSHTTIYWPLVVTCGKAAVLTEVTISECIQHIQWKHTDGSWCEIQNIIRFFLCALKSSLANLTRVVECEVTGGCSCCHVIT